MMWGKLDWGRFDEMRLDEIIRGMVDWSQLMLDFNNRGVWVMGVEHNDGSYLFSPFSLIFLVLSSFKAHSAIGLTF